MVIFDSVTPPQPAQATLPLDSLIDPASYGFDSVAAFDASHQSTALLEGTWFRKDAITSQIVEDGTTAHTTRTDGTGLLALERKTGEFPTIACIYQGRIIGHLGASDALRIEPVLRALVPHRRHLAVPTSLRLNSRNEGSVEAYVQLPSAEHALPWNGYPRNSWHLLPGGHSIEVPLTREAARQIRKVSPTSEAAFAVVLHSEVQIRARSALENLTVYVDHNKIGAITAAKVSPALPLVKLLDERGIYAVVKAQLDNLGSLPVLIVEVPSQHSLDPHVVDRLLSVPAYR